jgi:hypothetical protein
LFLVFRFGIGKVYNGAYDFINFLKYLQNLKYAEKLKDEKDFEHSDVNLVGHFKDSKKLSLFRQYSWISQDDAAFFSTKEEILK